MHEGVEYVTKKRIYIGPRDVEGLKSGPGVVTQFVPLTAHKTLRFERSLLQYWSAYIYDKEYKDFSALALIFIA
jgi:hypothetical protein